MSFASGTASFRRFLVPGRKRGEVTDEFIAAVNQHAFGRHAPAGADGIEIGWISPRHLFDHELDADKIACGRFVHLGLRVDRTAIPGGILRSYRQVEEDVALQASGREYLSKTERRKAHERAAERAEREARDGRFRRSAAYPVLIDLEGRCVLLATQSPAMGDRLVELFHDTFGAWLDPVTPEQLATKLSEAARTGRALEQLVPSHLVKGPAGGGDDEEGGSFETDLSYLGREFLTWLWFQSETGDGPITLSEGGDYTLMVSKLLRLECDFGVTGTDVITAEGPATLPEARAALAAGKQPTRMGMLLGTPVGEFAAVLNGPLMGVSGLTLPDDQEQRDPRAQREHRFEQIFDFVQAIDRLYTTFLERRLSNQWSRDLRALAGWAAAKK